MSLSQEKRDKLLELHDDPDWTMSQIIDELDITRGQYQYYCYDKPRRQENKEEYRKKQNEYRKKRYDNDEEFKKKQQKRSREVS